MSDTQDFATFPVVATQVKLGGWSRQGGGSVSLCPRPHQELQAFLSLLEHSFLQEFLSRDPCFQISDKYLLAMVLVYFRRANLKLSEYTHSNLFLALFLANDMEEDLEDPKCVIFLWALGKDWRRQVADFLHQRDKLWARMGFRAMVSRQCCEELVSQWPKTPWWGASSSSCPPNCSWSRAPTLSTPLPDLSPQSSRSLHRALGADICRVKSSPPACLLTQALPAVGPPAPPRPSVLLATGWQCCPGPPVPSSQLYPL
ncbi:speedy protein C isoform X4 [Panthera tigris]|uniref:speedy protein C isoform X4 n=1 Tax=Panthera tigris TaxID=9694 RepID=UPI001C6F9FD5|nr:speedy protein C isoform X4 [Panthera tigris]